MGVDTPRIFIFVFYPVSYSKLASFFIGVLFCMVVYRIFKFYTSVVALCDSGFLFKLLKVIFSQKHCTIENLKNILSKILLIALSSVFLSRLSAIDVNSMSPTA